jgi:hypothetical protein
MIAEVELPRYKCHKQVWALKIRHIVAMSDGAAEITPDDDRYAGFPVPKEYVDKHHPVPGGYYVVYQDGYKSFSPAEAFEAGYTRIE